MPRVSDKRERLLAAAKTLIHQQGFNQTTLADIARESKVPLGNVYYYFKTKEEIASAVIQERTEDWQKHVWRWEQISNPRKRLIAFLEHVIETSESLIVHGCPVGSLCQELDKTPSPLTEKANHILKIQLEWVCDQFRSMGMSEEATKEYGVQMMTSIQGGILMGNALNDAKVIVIQVSRLKAWLESL
jgi:TetR/AcrR family transcriptional regulator, transcriptional repressor for nem operon